jgi:hypothetical protein
MIDLNLTKEQKKAARQLIETGIQRDYSKGLSKVDRIIQQWKNGKVNNRDAYLKMFAAVQKHDKNLGRRYDNMTGSKYFMIILGLFGDKVIKEEELDVLGEEVKQKILHIMGM